MNKGDILYHREFRFYNGDTSNKLLVILNTPPKIEIPYLVSKTTSNPERKPQDPGCHLPESLFLIKANHDFFAKDTWLQFYDLYELNSKDLLKDKFDGLVEVCGCLREQTINEVTNCINRSEDVSGYHLKLIGQRGKT